MLVSSTQSPPARKALPRRYPIPPGFFYAPPLTSAIYALITADAAVRHIPPGRAISLLVFSTFRRFSAFLLRRYAAFTESDANPLRALLPAPLAPEERDPNRDLQSNMDEFVTIATFDKTTEAHIAMGRLAAEGIQAVLFDDNMVQMDWLYAIALGGIKLRVTRGDETAARRILATDYSHDLDDVDVGKPET